MKFDPSEDEAGFSVFLAGDAQMTLPWSKCDEPEFAAIIASMRAADVTVVNLETVIHSFRGYPQADSGGTWSASPPEIARELAWAGVDMVAHANNHTFDYGSEGVLETIEHVTGAGIVLAGSGKDLQAAAAPAEFVAKGRKIALVSMAATFVPYGKASRSRHDSRGRPGLNPLALTSDTVIRVPPSVVAAMRRLDGFFGRDQHRYEGNEFRRFGFRWELGRRLSVLRGKRPIPADRDRNLAMIAEAASDADLVVVSIHAHEQIPWIREFARDAVEAGGDVIFVQGPHEVRAIEFIDNCPVFYGLGDFVYQASQVAVHPSEAYEAAGLDDSARPEDLHRARTPVARLAANRKAFEGCAALLTYRGKECPDVRLLPLDLQFGGGREELGRPRLAEPGMAKRIIDEIAGLSRKYGVDIVYDAARNLGIVSQAQDERRPFLSKDDERR